MQNVTGNRNDKRQRVAFKAFDVPRPIKWLLFLPGYGEKSNPEEIERISVKTISKMNNKNGDTLYVDWRWRTTIRRLFIFGAIGLALFIVKEITYAFKPPNEIVQFEGKDYTVPVDVWWVYTWERVWEVWLVLLALIAIYYLKLGLIVYVLWWKKNKSEYS